MITARVIPDMPVDKVEWMVGYCDDKGQLVTTQDGAQSVFSRSSGEKLAKRLGEPWGIVHMQSMLPPAQHDQWLEMNKDASPAEPGWGKATNVYWGK